VIPLGTPVVTPSGETISSITIAKGTTVFAPIRCINRSEALWGPDAKEFKPERWFEEVTAPAKDLLGHRHLLTFHDGPRTCLGKSFALAEFKVCPRFSMSPTELNLAAGGVIGPNSKLCFRVSGWARDEDRKPFNDCAATQSRWAKWREGSAESDESGIIHKSPVSIIIYG
jgi:cytochrome P450